MKFFTVFIAVLIFSLPVSASVAAVVADLYAAERVVSDQGLGAMRRVAADAMGEVLVRVTGNRQVLYQDEIRAALRRADEYVLQYGYGGVDVTDDGEPGQRLKLEFDARAVGELLRAAGQPIWSARRPELLLWLLLDRPDGQEYLTPQTAPALCAELLQRLAERGVPALFPLFDLEDELRLARTSIAELDGGQVLRAAARYGAPAVLSGRILQLSNGNLVGDWMYLQAGAQSLLGGESPTPVGLFDAAVDRIAESLAAEYAITPVRYFQEGILLSIEGVSDYPAYARLVRALESIEAVTHANVVRVEEQTMHIRLQAEGSLEQLQRAIDLATDLDPIPGDASTNLAYRMPTRGELR